MSSSTVALEGTADTLECWLIAFTALVVVGLVVEYWRPVVKAIRRRSWARFAVSIGGILVTVGVAGELAVQFLLSPVQTQLRENGRRSIARANAKTERARADARAAQKMALPRELSNQITPGLDALRVFAGTTLAIVSAPARDDIETSRFASSLTVVDRVLWKVKTVWVNDSVGVGLVLFSPKSTSWKTGKPSEPDDPKERTWAAAEALRKHVKDETGEDARHWPIEEDAQGNPVLPSMVALRAAGVELSDSLVVAYVGKRWLERETLDRELSGREGP